MGLNHKVLLMTHIVKNISYYCCCNCSWFKSYVHVQALGSSRRKKPSTPFEHVKDEHQHDCRYTDYYLQIVLQFFKDCYYCYFDCTIVHGHRSCINQTCCPNLAPEYGNMIVRADVLIGFTNLICLHKPTITTMYKKTIYHRHTAF